MANGEQAVMDEIRRRAGEGSEVVCIIRDRNNPQAKSEVITLDRASPAFVNQLSRAGQPRNAPHETSLEVPKRPTPILEWDIETGWRHREPCRNKDFVLRISDLYSQPSSVQPLR